MFGCHVICQMLAILSAISLELHQPTECVEYHKIRLRWSIKHEASELYVLEAFDDLEDSLIRAQDWVQLRQLREGYRHLHEKMPDYPRLFKIPLCKKTQSADEVDSDPESDDGMDSLLGGRWDQSTKVGAYHQDNPPQQLVPAAGSLSGLHQLFYYPDHPYLNESSCESATNAWPAERRSPESFLSETLLPEAFLPTP
jgi:hypothetical protein